MGGAWFKRNEQRGALRAVPSHLQGHNFGMALAGRQGKTLTNDSTVLDQHRADGWIGACVPHHLPGQRQGSFHVVFRGTHGEVDCTYTPNCGEKTPCCQRVLANAHYEAAVPRWWHRASLLTLLSGVGALHFACLDAHQLLGALILAPADGRQYEPSQGRFGARRLLGSKLR